MTLTWDPAWTVVRTPTGVVVSAGPDLTFEIDGLDERTIVEVVEWERCAEFAPSSETTAIASQLIVAGAIDPGLATLNVRVAGEGDVAEELARRFAEAGSVAAQPSTDDGGVELPTPLVECLDLVVRTSNLPLAAPASPHLLVDVTGHHTLVLGPLVVPGFTACVECLRRRHEWRWPEAPVPPEPRISQQPAVVAELVGAQLRRIRTGTSPLLNATMTWDFESGVSRRDDLLRVPGCTGSCLGGPNGGMVAEPSRADRIRLPWVDSA